MNVYEIIIKKRNGFELSRGEIDFLISGFTRGEIPDYQIAAFLMAVFFRGMNTRESVDLTMSMVNSGEKIDLSAISGFKVDKHSTGGVGDTTTLVLGPLVASAGGIVAKMTGRGLGHTGGTIDKLESIPGFKIGLLIDEFINNVNSIHIAIAGQTAELAPADKKLYALRDVTATVDCIPLIAGSVMSKKIAAGADGIVLDVKTGRGAFMQKYADALKLAKLMVGIGEGAGKKMAALITDMSQPLGFAIGNSLEVKEAIDTLKGEGPPDLTELCLALGSHMLQLSGIVKTQEQGIAKLKLAIKNGAALAKFKEFIKAQAGDPAVVDDPKLLPKCKEEVEIKSWQSGYIQSIDALEVGFCALTLGAGRLKKDDKVNPAVGIVLKKKVGDKVSKDEPLAVLHTDGDSEKIKAVSKRFIATYKIGKKPCKKAPFIYSIVTKDKVKKL